MSFDQSTQNVFTKFKPDFELGQQAFKNGISRKHCPTTYSHLPNDPMDADNDFIFAWLLGWDQACRRLAYKKGCKAVITNDLCPYEKNDVRLRQSWIKGFRDVAIRYANGCPEEH